MRFTASSTTDTAVVDVAKRQDDAGGRRQRNRRGAGVHEGAPPVERAQHRHAFVDCGAGRQHQARK